MYRKLDKLAEIQRGSLVRRISHPEQFFTVDTIVGDTIIACHTVKIEDADDWEIWDKEAESRPPKPPAPVLILVPRMTDPPISE